MITKNVYLFDRHIHLLGRLIESRKKAIRRKFKDKIQADWYDMSDQQIEQRIIAKSREYETLCDAYSRLYEN